MARTWTEEITLEAIWKSALPITGAAADYDPILELCGDARLILLGEATHGTHEFYRARAEITKRLIVEKGFAGVAVEADWPDAYRVNRYVHGRGEDGDSEEALTGFRRFPTWMWRNADVLDLVGWLRAHNDAQRGDAPRAAFYGIDLYSLYASIEAVIAYLDGVDPPAAQRARQRYACFDRFEENGALYGQAAGLGLHPSCETAVIHQLLDLQQRSLGAAEAGRGHDDDERFAAEQNARLIRSAEQYYRSMFGGRTSSWNLRDQHMMETLEALVAHLDREGRRARLVVWAHNSHLGDARATSMGAHGELNVGQLARERFHEDAVLIGFSTYSGTVTAASDWDEPAERKSVRPALEGSYEALFHQVRLPRFVLPLREACEAREALAEPALERAIGVIYRPDTERQSHYFHARLSDQFDAIIHFDETRAVEPLERTSGWITGEPPETYPSAL
jgi:erythromycin esterase-like protein